MIIAFVHSNKAFLPELDAYQRFFAGYGVNCFTTTPAKLGGDRDVDWWLMGTDFYKPQPGVYRIHEYASGSVPPARHWKDLAKRFLNNRPHYRLFLNAYVKDVFSFRDNVPYGFRDMGLWPEQLSTVSKAIGKLYDFIYVGSVRKDTHIEKLLDHFAVGAPLAGRSLLVVSREYEHLRSRYSASANIVFKGPVDQSTVMELIQQARFAINYKPDIAPHNQQTSTKLLEYAACRTPIITTHFAWMRDFEVRSGGRYFYLQPDLSNFTWEKVQAFDYAFPDLTEWMWEKQIRGSGVLELLAPRFPKEFAKHNDLFTTHY